MRHLLKAAVFLSALSLVACGGGEAGNGAGDAGGSGSSDSGAQVFEVTGNDTMNYSVNEITAKAGEITIKFKNVGQLPKTTMGHNLVVLKPGQDTMAFSTAVMGAGGNIENNHLPESMKGDVVAATKVLGPGEEESITFTAEAGVYPYVCTFPGHAAIMKGTITVE